MLLPLLFFVHQSLVTDVSVSDLQWLKGTWQQQKPTHTVYETWQQKDDSTLTSISYYLKAADTVVLEHVSLQKRQGKLIYIASVEGQNNEQPVGFTLTGGSATHLIFENTQHDFPQRISYRYHAPDSLIAEISGTLKGKSVTRQFPMQRVK